MAQLFHTRHTSSTHCFKTIAFPHAISRSRTIRHCRVPEAWQTQTRADCDCNRNRNPKPDGTTRRRKRGGTFSDDGLPCRTGFGWPAYCDHASIDNPLPPLPPTKSLPTRQSDTRTVRIPQQRHHGRRTRCGLLVQLCAAVQPSGATLHLPKDALVDGGTTRRRHIPTTCSLGSVTPRKGGFRRVGAPEGGSALGKRARWPEGEGDLQYHPCCLLLFTLTAAEPLGWLVEPPFGSPRKPSPTPLLEAKSRHGMGKRRPAESVQMLEPTPRGGPNQLLATSDCLRERHELRLHRGLAKVLPYPCKSLRPDRS